jgi:hypothetical protein
VWAGDAGQAHRNRELELLDRVVNNLVNAALSLHANTSMSSQPAANGTAEALHLLDNTIREVRDHVFSAHSTG